MTDSAPPVFTRPDLLKKRDPKIGGFFEELDVRWINPREYHRKIISDLEDLGYQILREKNESLNIKQEAIGSKTGYVVSRAKATKEQETTEDSMSYYPYRTEGAASIVIGIILILFQNLPMTQPLQDYVTEFYGLGALLMVIGIVLIILKRREHFKMHFENEICVLAEGEATERKFTQEGAEVTDILSQLTVSIAGIKTVFVKLKEISNLRVQRELRKLSKDVSVETPQSISLSPLKKYIPTSNLKSIQEDTSSLRTTLDRLTQKLETYGHTIS